MKFGELLEKEFNLLTKGGKYSEVQLITKLEDSIKIMSEKAPMLVEIIHGNKSLVEFEYEYHYISKISPPVNKKCELGDMLYIVFSKKKRLFRIMYMQNKMGKDWDDFYFDLIQFALLNHKPSIISSQLPECVFENRDILKNAILPSVTAYGIFYQTSESYDMSYFPTSKIYPEMEIGISKRRKAECDLSEVGKTIKIYDYYESQGEKNIINFGNALYDMKIGTPFEVRDEMYDRIESFLSHNSSIWNNNDFQYESEHNFLKKRDIFFDSIPTVCIINADYPIEELLY